MADWLHEQSRAALAEGWDIYHAISSDNGEWQLQRCDATEVFPDDISAWRHVRARADAGSVLHLAALTYLAERNPDEHVRILAI